jgi:hypothetical protein
VLPHVDSIRFSARFLAVPIKSARLRIQLNAGHRREHIDHLVDILERHQHLAAPSRSFAPPTAPWRPTRSSRFSQTRRVFSVGLLKTIAICLMASKQLLP